MRHTFISVSMSRKKIAAARERNYQFRYSENCYTECCGLSRFGMFVHTSLKEATVHWQKPQHDTEQYCWYWKWLIVTLAVSSGFSNMVLQSTQPVDQWLALEQCFQDTSSDIVLRQFIPVMFWILRNTICPIHSNKRPPKTDLYKPYPPRNAYTASILKHSLILLFYIFVDPGFFKKTNLWNFINRYVMYILYNTYILGFEILILYICGCFSFILVNSLMIAILTETCC